MALSSYIPCLQAKIKPFRQEIKHLAPEMRASIDFVLQNHLCPG